MTDQIKGIIFDFDGVILDSAKIKTEAFLELFEEYPQHLGAIRDYHIQHQGITRYKKFEWIYNELLGEPYTAVEKKKLGEGFSKLVFEKVMEVDPLPGAIDFLRRLQKSNIKAFVASGTPDKELEMILEGRNLDNYFDNVYGSNISKEEAIDRISENQECDYSELLFIGDAITDYEAAKSRDVPFVAVYSEDMKEFWSEKEIKPVTNLMQIYADFDRYAVNFS